MVNNYLIEIEYFKYNKEKLLDFQYNLVWHINNLYAKSNKSSANFGFYDKYLEEHESKELFTDIMNQVAYPIKITDIKFHKILKGGIMPYHCDPFRDCILLLPLTENPSPIHFVDDKDNLLFSHSYSCATILNGKIRHGVPYNDKERISLQVNIHKTWDFIQENYPIIFPKL